MNKNVAIFAGGFAILLIFLLIFFAVSAHATSFALIKYMIINKAYITGNMDEIENLEEKEFYSRFFEISKQLKQEKQTTVNIALYISTFVTIQNYDINFSYDNITTAQIKELINNSYIRGRVLYCSNTIITNIGETEAIENITIECDSKEECVCPNEFYLLEERTIYTFSNEQYKKYLKEKFLVEVLPSEVLSNDINTRDKELDDIINDIYQTYKDILKNRDGTQDLSFFSMPVLPVNCVITSPYGERIDPISYRPRFHYGIDIVTSPKEIYAVGDGVVSYVRTNVLGIDITKGGGNIIYITHDLSGTKYESVYAHLAYGSIKVNVGDVVEKGQVIGIMGTTGYSTGVHLHFEIKMEGTRINPTSLFIDNCFSFR